MKQNKQKILWYHALWFGLAQIGDGIITIFTLGNVNGEFAMNVATKIGRWRIKYKEKKWRK